MKQPNPKKRGKCSINLKLNGPHPPPNLSETNKEVIKNYKKIK